MSDLTIALITIFGTVVSVTGVILYVFNGTKQLIREMHEGQRKIEEIAEQRHREVVELLKKGFSELIQQRTQ